MTRSPLHQQVDSLPELVRDLVGPLVEAAEIAFPGQLSRLSSNIYLTGCGDSHQAALAASLAFQHFAGLPSQALTAMTFARYTAPYLPAGSILFAISVSGRVSRTIEALRLARQAGAVAFALTGDRRNPLARETDRHLLTAVPPLPDLSVGQVIPGARSYVASLLALYLSAIQIGEMRGHLARRRAIALRRELADVADQMEATIATVDPLASALVDAWLDLDGLVICGAGPNYGTALFSAAKFLEASGDRVSGQDLEEWAHLQYFARPADAPTILIGALGRDRDRFFEIFAAARAIGRRLAVIAPTDGNTTNFVPFDADLVFPVTGPIREPFSPLLTCLPGLLLAAYRAQLLGEPYFRDFSGGRSITGGGGISRIRTSHQVASLAEFGESSNADSH